MINNFHQLIHQEKINVEFTKEELTVLQYFLDDKVKDIKNEILLDVLYKIGLVYERKGKKI